jgi:hypothetical protein
VFAVRMPQEAHALALRMVPVHQDRVALGTFLADRLAAEFGELEGGHAEAVAQAGQVVGAGLGAGALGKELSSQTAFWKVLNTWDRERRRQFCDRLEALSSTLLRIATQYRRRSPKEEAEEAARYRERMAKVREAEKHQEL